VHEPLDALERGGVVGGDGGGHSSTLTEPADPAGIAGMRPSWSWAGAAVEWATGRGPFEDRLSAWRVEIGNVQIYVQQYV
jgi:hypothetical protein